MLFIALTMMGYISYRNLDYELTPNTELPFFAVVVGGQQEVEPSYMEKKVIIPLEGVIGTLEKIESIESTISRRQGVIFVYYEKDIDIKFALLKLQEKIDQAKDDIPEEFFVNIYNFDFSSYNYRLMNLLVMGSGDIDRIRNIGEKEVVDKLENIDGIAQVDISGGRSKSVIITLNEESCKAHDITPSQVNAALRNQNLEKAFVGQAYQRDKRFFVNVEAEFDDIEDIKNTRLGKRDLRIKDVADVFFGYREESQKSRINGMESVSIILHRDPQSNMIDISQKTKEVIEELNKKLKSKDIEILIQYNSADDMEKNLDLIIQLSIIGAFLAMIVLWLFLRNIRLILVIGLAIPISVYTAFNLFYAFDITINNLTMVGIILAIGMLLDNSIVVLENIYGMVEKGFDSRSATIQGTKDVVRPVIAATLTSVAVFVPFFYTSHFLLKMFGANVGISIVSTLIVSLLAALLLVPMLTNSILKRYQNNKIEIFQSISIRNLLINRYVVILKSCMRRPALTILGSLVVFFVIIFIALAVSVGSSEEVELSNIDLYVTMPSGSTLEQTDELVEKIEGKLLEMKEFEEIYSEIKEEEASFNVQLKEDYEREFKKSYAQIKDEIRRRTGEIENANISFDPPVERGSSGNRENSGPGRFLKFLGLEAQKEQILIKGEDFELMHIVANNIKSELDDMTDISNTNLSVRDNQPEINLYFKEPIVAKYDIPLSNVLSELNTFSPEVSTGITLIDNNEEYDVIIKTDSDTIEQTDKTIYDLNTLSVRNNEGASFELLEISKLIYSEGLSEIYRVNGEKQIDLNYSFTREVRGTKSLLKESQRDVEELIQNINIPSGIAVEVLHEESLIKQFRPIILIALILIYMILASIFESFYSPFVIMFTIILAIIGALTAVLLTGNSIQNTNVLMGALILIGIVVNNGVILIDYINLLKKRGYSEYRAIITAGISRVRPILITAITTIIAMFPLAMGKAEYIGSIGSPFAITVIGGLALSTVLTLVYVPTLYISLRNSILWIAAQKPKTIIIMALSFAILFTLIVLYVDRMIFQILLTVLILIVIPSLAYLIVNSLRIAKSNIIEEEKEIKINIENLVKIYDREKRFKREWAYGLKYAENKNSFEKPLKWDDFGFLVWQLPLMAFLVYFIYFYLNNNFWSFLIIVLQYFYLSSMLRQFQKISEGKAVRTGNQKPVKRFNLLLKLFFWLYPLPNLVWFYFRWENIASVIIAGVFWYLTLGIATISKKIYGESINIQRLTGRFKKLRYFIFNLVVNIPLIGKKQESFKALSGVSLEIGTGMFGLLGPNGAGKSTMMKIICGIIDQSYGKIWINGYDTRLKREELQGLIGYMPQEFGMYENMTAYNFLDYMAILKNIHDPKKRKERVAYVLKEVNMFDNAQDRIGSFSGGMKQRIGIAQILLHLPRILVVDEPTAGIDPRERIRFRNLLIELSRKRIIIFSTHIIEDISSSCNKVAVLNKGKIKYLGNPKEMTKIAEGHVWQFYVPVNDFEQTYNQYLVVNHMRDGDRVKIRCISKDRPVKNAENLSPNLEDAYLWLQNN